jgi:hypothetical protein
MYNTGDIFLGNTPSPERAFMHKALSAFRENYDRLIIPCCGGFAMPEVAVEAGWKPEQLSASDISLFSSIVGYHAAGKPFDDLGIEFHDEVAEFDTGDAATILFALRLSVYLNRRENDKLPYYESLTMRDLLSRPLDHIASIRSGLYSVKEKIGGMEYHAGDLVEHAESELGDPRAIVWLAPPFLAGDYEKMFNHGHYITWNEPVFNVWKPADGMPALKAKFYKADALAFIYQSKALAETDIDKAVWARQDTSDVKYILCNQPETFRALLPVEARPKPLYKPQPIKGLSIWTEEDIVTPDMMVDFVEISGQNAMYYKDLFAHQLPASGSEWAFAVLFDGKIVGVVGFFADRLYRGTASYVSEAFGMMAPVYRYARLSRLLMMLITTNEFLAQFGERSIYKPTGVTTVAVSKHPEHKPHRGIMKLTSKELKPNGLYHLKYAGDATNKSYREVVVEWLAKHGSYSRTNRKIE